MQLNFILNLISEKFKYSLFVKDNNNMCSFKTHTKKLNINIMCAFLITKSI